MAAISVVVDEEFPVYTFKRVKDGEVRTGDVIVQLPLEEIIEAEQVFIQYNRLQLKLAALCKTKEGDCLV